MKDVAVIPKQDLSVGSPHQDFPMVDINSLFSEAVKQGSAMEVIKELRLMESEHHARRARTAFDEAMSSFQVECPVIRKEKAVPDRSGKTAYSYAPIEDIEVQIRPFCQKNGFSHTFDTDTTSDQGWVIAKCIVKHRGGHECISTGKFPLGTKTGIMSDTQVYAAALTFANRRALCNAYGLVLAGEDMDGRAGTKQKPQGPSAIEPDEASVRDLAVKLWALMASVRGAAKSWDIANQWLWREEILDGGIPETAPHLPEKRFRETIAAVTERLAK